MLFTWEPIYSVNVKELDEQHKKIFAIINRVFEMKKIYSPDKPVAAVMDQVKEILKELEDYGSYHFETEEKYFKKFDYPDAAPHEQQHDKYKEEIAVFEKKVNEAKDSKVIEELAAFLQDWWLDHVQNVDQQYSDFFNEHGLF